MRNERQIRSIPINYEMRSEDGNPVIEGYFAVYNSLYEIAPGMSESIAPGAFQNSLSGDIRMLINHDTAMVVGRTTAHTLELRDDTHGLWARAAVNPKDSAAMDAHARVERGDVSQASIGFEIIKEDTEIREDGSIHWTIRDAVLHEVSICTFPAYEETNISARTKQAADIKERALTAWRETMKRRLHHGPESPDAQKETE